jgi:hypothetical protein
MPRCWTTEPWLKSLRKDVIACKRKPASTKKWSSKLGSYRPEADATQFSALIVIALEIRERANPSIPLSRHFSFSIAYSLSDSHQVIEHPRSARMPSNEMKTTQPHHQARHTAHGDYVIPGCSWQ